MLGNPLPVEGPDPDVPVSVIAGDRSWIEGDALVQLERVARLPGMIRAVGLPDLHAGAGAPIGAALLSDRVWPHLVGSDIGCGVALWRLPAKRGLSAERIAKLLSGLDRVRSGELDDGWADRFGAPDHEALGTIGAGNHFVEVGRVHEVFDPVAAAGAGLELGGLVLLVHTGSRGLGREILMRYTRAHAAAPCPEDLLETYLAEHDAAMRFATANRAAVAQRAATRLGIELDASTPLLDLTHNAVARTDAGWLHRKGAAPNLGGLVALPGSRGARSYVVSSTDDEAARAAALWSVAHGAGRKYSRSSARDRFREVPRRALRTSEWGSVVICSDPQLLLEEAPGAYKDIERVVGDLVDARLVTPVVATVPVVTYKTERGGAGPEARESRQQQRSAARQRSIERRGATARDLRGRGSR